MSRFEKLKALSAPEWKALLAAGFLLPLTGVLLKVFGVQKTRRTLGKAGAFLPGSRDAGSGTVNDARRIARMVSIAAARGPYRADCLKKSIVLELLMKRRGMECDVKFGARAASEQFGAHAWVEFRGEPLADPGGNDGAIRVLN